MKNPLNPELNVGDRIILYHMDGETSVPLGTKGTVISLGRDPFELNDEKIIRVQWDNGSTLSLITTTDAWKKVPNENINEQTGLSQYDFFRKNSDVFEFFDWRWFRDYLKKVQDTGIVNMLSAAPLLYSGKDHIDRYYGENREDEEDFQELLEIADESKDKLVQGIIKYMEANNLELDDMGKVNQLARRFSQSLLGTYIQFYS